ncbi:MAG: transglutaminase domain-containing protein [Acidobacteriota bacterium]
MGRMRPRLLLACAAAALAAMLLSCAPLGQRASALPGAESNRIIEALDAHVLATPPGALTSVRALTDYLVEPARDDREKAWVLFRWITANIRYDQAGAASGGADVRPEAVLRRGEAVCAGYTDLFLAMAAEAGLGAVSVSGYAKGAGYEAGDRFSGPPNHSWNAVRVDGSWRLVDCTWGAGFVDEAGQYVRWFEPYYFLTPPERLIYTHLPEDPRWQLLEAPVTLARFEQLPYVKAPFFTYGLRLGSDAACTVEVKGARTTMEVEAPPGVTLHPVLLRGAEKVDAPEVVSRGDRTFMTVTAPGAGTYTLRLYVGSTSDLPGALPRWRRGRSGLLLLQWAMDTRLVFRPEPRRKAHS